MGYLVASVLFAYEAFAQAAASDLEKCLKALPEGTRHEHTMMPLRDGVKLATEIFLPKGEGRWPVMLLRTPYSRWDVRGHQAMGGEPCVVVCQNQRGRYGSEGHLPRESFDNEVDDSYDAIEWCAKQPWCNGKVGMWGSSGHGVSASNAVWSRAPHLVAVDVNITADNAYLHWVFSNGCRRAFYTWLGQRNMKVADWPRPTTSPFDLKARQAFIAERAAGNPVVYLAKAGWFDLFSEGALDTFAALASNGRAFVVVSPGGHGPIGGDLTYPYRPYPKGVQLPTLKQCMTEAVSGNSPAANTLLYYLMGDTKDPKATGNVWKASHTWPVPHTPTSYFMRKDGTLNLKPPMEKDASLTYEYDPRNPAPSLGGNYGLGAKSGPHDQRPLKDRLSAAPGTAQAGKDVLRFVTEPLAEPVAITGKVWAELHVSSDAPDTEFVAKLVDIHPDGYEALMRESAMLARYWQGLDKPAPMEKGKVYALKMDLWSTALVFNRGHRIAVLVTSSSHPAYEVHPNSYEPVMSMDKAPVALNAIHLSADHASRLILPVVGMSE